MLHEKESLEHTQFEEFPPMNETRTILLRHHSCAIMCGNMWNMERYLIYLLRLIFLASVIQGSAGLDTSSFQLGASHRLKPPWKYSMQRRARRITIAYVA